MNIGQNDGSQEAQVGAALGPRLWIADWPAQDRMGWERARSEFARLSLKSTAWRWKPSTANNIARGYGLFLTWLAAHELLSDDDTPESRVTQKAVLDFVDQLRAWGQRDSSISTTLAQIALAIKAIVDCHNDDPEWAWLSRFSARLVPRTTSADIIQSARAADIQELLALGQHLMTEAEAGADAVGGSFGKAQALTYRDGLLVGFQTLFALRPGNLLGLHLGHSITNVGGRWRLHISGGQTKTRTPIEARLPKVLEPRFQRYVDVFRPLLAADGKQDPSAVWLAHTGRPLGASAAWQIVTDRTQKAFGRSISLHRFRHIAATTVAVQAPELMGQVSAVLSHARVSTTLKYYALAEDTSAFTKLHEAIEQANGFEPDRLHDHGERNFRRP